jgi:hypothetical protein
LTEFPNVSSILGIIGTITGIIALFISYWTFRAERPRLTAKMLECKHSYSMIDGKKRVNFFTTLEISNRGDRGTTINEVEVTFEIDGKKFSIKKDYFRGQRVESKRRWINSHEIIEVEPDFSKEIEMAETTKIDCTFNIYHTHGRVKTKFVSEIYHVPKI